MELERNVVLISLEDYKELIAENIALKEKLTSLKTRASKKIEEEVKYSLIDALKIDETKNWLNCKDMSKILNQFGPSWSYKYESIAYDSVILTEVEVKRMTAEVIISQLQSHLKDLLELEESKNESL